MSFAEYAARVQSRGLTKQATMIHRTREYYLRKYPIDRVVLNSEEQEVFIVNTSEMGVKTLCSLHPGTFYLGDLFSWKGLTWMITDFDARDEVYDRFEIQQCNYTLKFKNSSGTVVEQQCIITDVTKYLVGERAKDMMTVGDSRMSLLIQKNSDTVNIVRGMRFVIDDVDAKESVCYEMTKPDRITGLRNGRGYYKFLVREANSIPGDDMAEMVPDNEPYKPANPDTEGGWF